MLERRSTDEADINEQQISAVQSILQRCNEEVVYDQEYSKDTDHIEEESERDESKSKDHEVDEKKRKTALSPKVSAKVAKKIIEECKNKRAVYRKEIVTGNKMIDQFEPWYFGVAFAFMFKYCTGMPDSPKFMHKPRYTRKDGAPYVEAPAWMRIMGRRVESQVSRDWNFGFVTWNYVFRSSLNMSRNIFAFDRESSETGEAEFTATDLQEGAKEICRAMWSTYTDVNGRKQKVLGDMTKIRYVPGLSRAAQLSAWH